MPYLVYLLHLCYKYDVSCLVLTLKITWIIFFDYFFSLSLLRLIRIRTVAIFKMQRKENKLNINTKERCLNILAKSGPSSINNYSVSNILIRSNLEET